MKQILLFLLAALLLTGCTAKTPEVTTGTKSRPDRTTVSGDLSQTVPPTETAPTLPAVGYRCNPYLFYSSLTDPIYYADACRLVDAIAAYEDYLPIQNAGIAEAIADNIFYNYPPAALCTFEADAGGINIRYTYEKDEHQLRITEFYQKVETILNETVDPAWSELRRAMELYRYVATHVSYFTVDYTAADTSAYSALTRGVTICYGFADAYNYLLRQAGIESQLLRGSAGEGNDHGWSIIRIDGEWYHCDPTWEYSGSGGRDLWYFGVYDYKRFGTVDSDIVYGFGALEVAYPGNWAVDDSLTKACENVKYSVPWKFEQIEQLILEYRQNNE